MKNPSTIINVILGIAVAVLFYLHFSSSQDLAAVRAQQEDTTPNKTFAIPKNLQGAKVLYVNIDSINTNYRAFSELSQEAGSNLQNQMAVYQRKAAALQDRYAKLQEQVNMGTISTDAAEAEEKSINAGLDELKRMETNLAYLESNAMQKNDMISQEIALYFREYAMEKGIDYIMMFGTGMPIIYANDSLDVTNDVLVALNQEYDARKAQEKTAPKK
ncbi:MAG TPA: OmpH family outer membrane protein [Bacteroidia bacterium]|nr:OmpH family outer membrane protein [Bacteroidia bacterium]